MGARAVVNVAPALKIADTWQERDGCLEISRGHHLVDVNFSAILLAVEEATSPSLQPYPANLQSREEKYPR